MDKDKHDKTCQNGISLNAEVWKQYVNVTDHADKELVEGWNKSLDMLLIFAALFSAISTAFILESTRDLKPDYAEMSAHSLAAILAVVASGSPTNDLEVPAMHLPDFSPRRAAIQVNILWFTSLSLSVAVALVAIVAKDWCYYFMSDRTGQLFHQGKRRHLRWEGIQRWKMQEILNVLPLMMHAALLLFAAGLSLYLWDINPKVALPVIITTVVVGLFYVVTLFMPIFLRGCPYVTTILRLFPIRCSYYLLRKLYLIFRAFLWLVVPIATAVAIVVQCLKRDSRQRPNLRSGSHKPGFRSWLKRIPIKDCWNDCSNSLMRYFDRYPTLAWPWSKSPNIGSDEQNTPMDRVTSSMLSWMITECEDVQSIDLALHTIARAKPWLPFKPESDDSDAVIVACLRLIECMKAWESNQIQDSNTEGLRESVLLHSQALSIMTRREMKYVPLMYIEVVRHLHPILDQCWDRDQDYKQASKELGNLSLDLHMCWDRVDTQRKQRERQWELVEKILKQDVVDLSASDISHLVDGIAKSFVHTHDQYPIPLVRLLDTRPSRESPQLRRMVGVALTIAYLVNPGTTRATDSNHWNRHLARERYVDLVLVPPSDGRWKDGEYLLLYGLLGALLTCVRSDNSEGVMTVIDIICSKKDALVNPDEFGSSDLRLPQLPMNLLLQLVFPDTASSADNASLTTMPPSGSPATVVIEVDSEPVMVAPGSNEGEFPAPFRINLKDLNHMKLAEWLLGFARDVMVEYYNQSYWTPWRPEKHTLHLAVDAIIRSDFHTRAYNAIQSPDGKLTPHWMSFLWWLKRALLEKLPHHKRSTRLRMQLILRQLGATEEDEWIEYAKGCIEKIKIACKRDPQNVLDSGILDCMIDYCEKHPKNGRGTTSAPGSEFFDAMPSMLGDILQDCQGKVADSGQDTSRGEQNQRVPPAEGADNSPATTNPGETVTDDNL